MFYYLIITPGGGFFRGGIWREERQRGSVKLEEGRGGRREGRERVRIVGIIIIPRPDYSYVSNGHRRIRSSINHERDIFVG